MLNEQLFSLDEPFRISVYFALSNLHIDHADSCVIFSLVKLLLVHLLVHPVHFPHLLNFVKVNNETPFIGMVLFDAFSAEHCQMIGAVKVLHSLIVSLTQ